MHSRDRVRLLDPKVTIPMNSIQDIEQQPSSHTGMQYASDALWENDRLGRRPDAEHLLEVLSAASGPVVLSLEGSWGSGKTTFLEHFQPYLEERGFTVRYINAWETMRYANPTMSIIDAIVDDTADQNEPDSDSFKSMMSVIKGFVTAVRGPAAAAGSLAAVGMPFHVAATVVQTGLAAVRNSVFEGDDEQAREEPNALTVYRKIVEDFETSTTALEAHLSATNMIVIFIDELDRCRPEYALAMLETIHHCFLVEGIAFVLTINQDELCNSLMTLYGPEFDARRYLRRFVNKQVHLSPGTFQKYVASKISDLGVDPSKDLDAYSAYLLMNFAIRSPIVSARDIDQRIEVLRPSIGAGSISVDTDAETSSRTGRLPLRIILATMGLMRLVAPEVYHQFCSTRGSDLQALDELNRIADRSEDWWRESSRPDEYQYNVVLEAVLIAWYRSLTSPWPSDTPLLRKRREEARAGADYPRRVVRESDHPAYRNRSDFREAMAHLR